MEVKEENLEMLENLEEVDKILVLNVQFCHLNDDYELEQNSVSDALTITVLAIKNVDVKEKLDIVDLGNWEEKFDIDVSDTFKIDLKDSITTYLDEDGDETSSYSNITLDEGALMAPPKMIQSEFAELAISHALGLIDSETQSLPEESKRIFKAIFSRSYRLVSG